MLKSIANLHKLCFPNKPWTENDFADLKKSGCEIVAELCGQGPVIRLLNLFANPNYAHLEDEDVDPAIPFLTERGTRSEGK